jgi:hypothetical protein
MLPGFSTHDAGDHAVNDSVVGRETLECFTGSSPLANLPHLSLGQLAQGVIFPLEQAARMQDGAILTTGCQPLADDSITSVISMCAYVDVGRADAGSSPIVTVVQSPEPRRDRPVDQNPCDAMSAIAPPGCQALPVATGADDRSGPNPAGAEFWAHYRTIPINPRPEPVRECRDRLLATIFSRAQTTTEAAHTLVDSVGPCEKVRSALFAATRDRRYSYHPGHSLKGHVFRIIPCCNRCDFQWTEPCTEHPKEQAPA